ncbi:MAG TPA: PDZ domain-containing protein [Candidatus Baltobacteraceae bacterium]|nr:PDZ domain-containing protein [Candidatus Baltobacteraceae bacterium]
MSFFAGHSFRIAVVLVVGGLVIFIAGLEMRRAFGYPLGEFGYASDGHVITGIVAGSSAARAGLRVGDRISWTHNSAVMKIAAAQAWSPHPGDRLNISVLGPHRRSLQLVSVPEDPTEFPFLILRNTAAILCVIVAGLLLLLRPRWSTWALFAYSVSAVGSADAVFSSITNEAAWASSIEFVRIGVSDAGLVVFAAMLGKSRPQGFEFFAFVLAAILGVAASASYALGPLGFGYWTYAQATTPDVVVSLLRSALPALLIVIAYVHAELSLRAKLQWVLAALLASSAASVADVLLYPEVLPYALHALFLAAPALVFAACAYVLLSSRVVDLNFVASRTLVYAVLTSFVVGVLALVDWFVTRQLDQVRLGFALEIAAALLLGVTIQRAHSWSDDVVDRYVFRAAHEAELHLKRLGAALVHAPSESVIDRMIVQDTADALSLSSAAVFHASGNCFVRTAASNWPESATTEIASGHNLALYLASEERPIIPDDIFSQHDALPQGAAHPALAIPFVVRHRLVGFALFGAHLSGAQPDGKDVDLLVEFISRAAAAFDHVAADQRTEENRTLRAENELLRSLVGSGVR